MTQVSAVLDDVDARSSHAAQSSQAPALARKQEFTGYTTPKAKRLTVTLLIPTLNEIDGMKVIMPQIDADWVNQIIILDGGSTDGTVEWAKENGYQVYKQTQSGIRQAYMEVLPHIEGDVILTFSPDGNSLAHLIPALVEKINQGYDMVIASRYLGPARSEDDDWITAFGNWLFTRTVNLLNGGRYTDAMVIFRAYRKKLISELELDQDRWYTTPENLLRTRISWEPLLSARARAENSKSPRFPVTNRRASAASESCAC